ncbi:alpha/beta fold hydrolase [Leifsonia sp. A12D58]|uniref:alpha/beta fold hydrolase n=1 Tax=Leifsonia sp. A12D58 TaxID=3397674 RepID=UPI0039DFD192
MSPVVARPDGVRIAYDVAEGKRPVLLVHGFASTAAATWGGTGWVRALVGAGRGVVTPDLRGHGRSGKPHRSADYTPTEMAADLCAVLDDAGIEQVDVIGYSMGVRVVSALTRHAPERIRRITLGGAGPIEYFSTWDVDSVDRFVSTGALPAEPTIAAVLRAALEAGEDREALGACVLGMTDAPLDVATGIPTLYVAGSADLIPDGVATLADVTGAGYLELPGRTHINALTSAEFKRAALAFLDED